MNWRWLILLVYTAAWTVALIAPIPDAEDLPLGEELLTHKVLFAKTVHVSAYAVFAILAGWLRPPPRWRLWLLFLLMFHGAGGEWLQENLATGRNGLLSDVLLDYVGIAAGVCVSWPWWTQDQA